VESGGEDFVVTAWEVRGKVDYDKLLLKFGAKPIGERELELLKQAAGEVHWLIKSGYFYAHRDLDLILERHLRGLPWALYTGRGPSGPVHIGHMIPWMLLKWLSDKLGVEVYFQLTDDEKFWDEEHGELSRHTYYAYDNAADVIALGFTPDKLHIIIDTLDIMFIYKIAVKVARKLTWNTVKATFGFSEGSNIGIIFYPSLQIAVAFLPTELRGEETPTLIPAAIDQDPYFRLARDVASELGYPKPATMYSKFAPSLTGESKMSASRPDSALYVTDSDSEIRRKILNAFTGGQPTAELQRRYGGNPDICPVYNYHMIFDPAEVDTRKIYQACKSGNLLCGECKRELIDKALKFFNRHREARERAKERVDEYRISIKFGKR